MLSNGASSQWLAHVTVAAVIEQDQRFLLVEEKVGDHIVLNQPAGHLEDNESLLSAVQRETLEETAWQFTPKGVVGLYLYRSPKNHITYQRICFSGTAHSFDPHRQLDHGILRAVWMTYEEIVASQDRHRSMVVKHCIDDYLAGKHYPLDLMTYFP